MDKGHSMAFGRPYIVLSHLCNVLEPSNIYDKDLTPFGPRNIRPLSECTEMSNVLTCSGPKKHC